MATNRDRIIEDAKKLAADVATYVSEKRFEAPARVQELREAAREQFETAKERARRGAKNVDEMARENVWVTAGIAAAAGAVIALLFSKKHRD